jgi:hypothetical protein
MNKKVVITIIVVLILLVIGLATALVLTNTNILGNKKEKYDYTTMANYFAVALKSKENMDSFINKHMDMRALYSLQQLYDSEINNKKDAQKLVKDSYNASQDKINETVKPWLSGIYTYVDLDLDLVFVSVSEPEPFLYDLEYEDITVTYKDLKENCDQLVTFTCYKGKVVTIAPDNGFEHHDGAYYQSIDYVDDTYSFVRHNGVKYIDDYSAFGVMENDVISLINKDILEVSYSQDNNKTEVTLKNGIHLTIRTNEKGYVRSLDFYNRFANNFDNVNTWSLYASGFIVNFGYEDFTEINPAMQELVDGIAPAMVYDTALPFPQVLYNNQKTIDHSTIQVIVNGISETDVDMHFILIPSSSENG